jgi:hypothetical protein
MDSHFEALRAARASLPDEVRQTADALLKLLEATAGAATPVRAALRVACEGVGRRLSETHLTIALVGDAGAGRRTLINALLGDRVLPTSTPRRGSTVTIVRRAPTLEFSALSLDGRSVARLSRKTPDRAALFEKSMAQIDRETTATEALTVSLQAARQRAAALETAFHDRDDGEQLREGTAGLARLPDKPAPLRSWRRAALLWDALWSWILPLVLRWSWLGRLLPRGASEGDARRRTPREQGARHVARPELEEARAAIAALVRELGGMRSVEQIAAHAERLRLERRRYEEQRWATFLSQVRAFDGTDISERIVEYPAKHLPDGLTLMDLPCPSVAGSPVVEQLRRRAAREVDALVVVEDVEQPPGEATASLVRELSDFVPLVLVVLTKADRPLQLVAGGPHDDVPSRIEHVRHEALERVACALGESVRRAPCILVAAEAALDARPESSAFADHFHTTIDALSERLEGERPVIIAWREALRMRVGVAELSRTHAGEEDSCRKRLSTLESKRIPDPAEFRGRLMDRLDGAIEKGADDVLAAATEGLRAAIEGLRSEWTERISSCTARGEVDACIEVINERAAGRIAGALEQTAEIVARELHDVTETLEAWAIEEIHTHYRLVRRLGAEALAPVASELTREDLERELLAAQPFQGAMDAFEKQRVGYGLGGVAAGAVLGTLIAPGIGTAVGAVLGVFAGLLKGTDSLKQECIARVGACLNDAESHARAQLQGKRTDLSRIIRLVLDEALEEALGRLNDAITRLMTIERRAIDRERAKLGDLTAARQGLEECHTRLTRVVESASCAPQLAHE